GVSANASKFKLFDAKAKMDSQVTTTSYTPYAFALRYNDYKADGIHTRFVTVATKFSVTNNLDDLKKVEVTDTQRDTAGNLTGERKKTYTALTGAYKKDLIGAELACDWFWVNTLQQNWGWHLFPTYTARTQSYSKVDAGIGFLRSFGGKQPAN